MSAIVINKQMVHYEVMGRGRPIIFLHSWLGSWRGWMPVMDVVSERYRTMAIDFWGFGDSAPLRDPAALEHFVDQLNGFVEALGIVTPHLVGHGLGGMVALHAAAKQPARYGKVLITGTPIVGSHLRQPAPPTSFGRLMGRKEATNDPWIKLVRQAATTAEYSDGFTEVIEDIEATDPEVVNAVLQLVANADLRSDLAQLEQPLLAIYGNRDPILPSYRGDEIEDTEGRFRQVLIFEKSGHFPFIDQANQFGRAVLQFCGDTDKVVELKAEWKRRVNQREFL